eukprot:jgi/Orpsp1_1/1190322/evm.model.d7180000078231.1
MFVTFGFTLGIDSLVNTDLESVGGTFSGLILFIVVFGVVFGLYIYYYLAVCSYMEDIQEELYIANQQRDIEENIPYEVRVANKY